jgi:regulator of RNase E activity RraB
MHFLSVVALCLACLACAVAPAASQTSKPPPKAPAAETKKWSGPQISAWGNYFTTINGALASVALDRSLRPKAPLVSRPNLLRVKVKLRAPKPNGLSDRSEAQALADIEDELRSQLKAATRATEVGRITTAGHRELFFYSAGDAGLQGAVSAVMQKFGAYKIEMESRADPEWSEYLDTLYPKGEDFQRMSNMDVIGGLLDAGDTLRPVRAVRHWIYFGTQADRQQIAPKIEALGYKLGPETDGSQDRPYGLVVTRNQSITPDQIDNAVIELYRLAQQAGAEYDGWEAALVASPKKR